MQRTKEIGIRMAFSASSYAIMRLVITQAGRLVAIGSGLGLMVSLSVAIATKTARSGLPLVHRQG